MIISFSHFQTCSIILSFGLKGGETPDSAGFGVVPEKAGLAGHGEPLRCRARAQSVRLDNGQVPCGERFGIIHFLLHAKNLASFIIERANQLHALMLTICWNQALLSFEELGSAILLVVPKLRLIFKQ